MENTSPQSAADLTGETQETLSALLEDLAARRIQRPPLSLLYKLGLVFVAIGMITLPLLYLAFILLLAGWVYHFATVDFLEIWEWPIGNNRFSLGAKVICSITPLLAGGIATLFMIKPLFAPRVRRMQPFTVNPEHEPVLYDFVHRLCRTVGAPPPREIHLNCAINASAGFRCGFLSLFGHDIVLTIGMPLAAGLSLRELAGVIAHEFGHFTQGAAMRLTYLIRRINGWFTRVVYQRDAWDAYLDAAAEAEDWWIQIMVGCARLAVWASRKVLQLLMFIGHAISGFLMRQMEYDADRFEMEVAGSEAFESTTARLALLHYASRDVYLTMRRSWRSTFQLPDDLPAFIAWRTASLPEQQQEKALAELGAQKTGLFDTHPAPMDRVSRARAAAQPGFIAHELPATALFENFQRISKFVTMAHYEDDLEIPATPEFLISTEILMQR